MADRPHDQDPQALSRAAVVHDVNQMLAVISGRVGLLLRRDPDPERRSHLEAIGLACRDAASMLERLRQGTPAEVVGGTPPVDGGSCRLAVQAEAVSELIRPAGRQVWDRAETGSRQEPRWVFAADVPPELGAAVPGQVVREVLSNLVLNALQAMPAGGTVTISATAAGGRVRMMVADEGPGLDPGALAQTLPAGGDPARPGRGVGLAGCRQLLAAHGGSLTVEKGSGQGAVLVVDLPAARAPADDRVVPGRADGTIGARAGELSPGGKVSVLVVDDEPAVRDMLADVLTELGCAVTTAADAPAALARFAPGAFQIALLDQSLPGMKGEELAKALRAGDSCLAVFLMTGWGNEDVLAAHDGHAVDFTARKPMEFDRLRQLLDEAADLHRRRRDRRA